MLSLQPTHVAYAPPQHVIDTPGSDYVVPNMMEGYEACEHVNREVEDDGDVEIDEDDDIEDVDDNEKIDALSSSRVRVFDSSVMDKGKKRRQKHQVRGRVDGNILQSDVSGSGVTDMYRHMRSHFKPLGFFDSCTLSNFQEVLRNSGSVSVLKVCPRGKHTAVPSKPLRHNSNYLRK